MNRKQFLLSSLPCSSDHLTSVAEVGRYHLLLGEESNYSCAKIGQVTVHMVGEAFDWQEYDMSNQDIVSRLARCADIEEMLLQSDRYCGEWILIIEVGESIYLVTDAAAQKEVYYDTGFSTFGSQPKLVEQVVASEHHPSQSAAHAYYSSEIFAKKKLYVGDETDRANIMHLRPNHVLDLSAKKHNRFYPRGPIATKKREEVAKLASEILKGYIRAVAHRHQLKLAVTGGYDSRILFLASKDVPCKYFVFKHAHMQDDHYDLEIPRQLTSHYGKPFEVESDHASWSEDELASYHRAVDNPRHLKMSGRHIDHCYINGNVSEVARNYFGYQKSATGADLCFLSGYEGDEYVRGLYTSWLKIRPTLHSQGYHYLDLFYWEEKMGNWAAKSKTETNALGRYSISPFNSRFLLDLLLSTDRSDRDAHQSKLYDRIIYHLSKGDGDITSMPINPSRKMTIVMMLKKLRLYNLYRYLGTKSRKIGV